jgi:dTDP-4-dehydrorhamnose 3,5-epimerase-like enzyme
MRNSLITDIETFEIPKIKDSRGNLSVIEKDIIPFDIKRVYYLYDIPINSFRGGHSHVNQKELLIAINGSFDVLLDDGKSKINIHLSKPNYGLLIPEGIWRELSNFSLGSLCLVISSDVFLENDYIRDYDEFIKYKNQFH